jgi:hypothetical protein
VAKAKSTRAQSGGSTRSRARSTTPAQPVDTDAVKAAEEAAKAAAANQAPEQVEGQGEGLAGAPTEISDAADVELSAPAVSRGAGRVDVHLGVKGAQEAAAQAQQDSIAEGEGPVVGARNKVAAPATVGIPGEEVDVRRHVPRTAPPAPTRFDGRDNPGSR